MKRVLAATALALGCAQPPVARETARPVTIAAPPAATPATPIPAKPMLVTVSIVGTNDLHGALTRLPLIAGYIANLRAARAADGGGVLLVDGGDLFQGTLESNLGEGADVVRAYNQMGYAASAVGTHEFDFGPVGPAVTASGPQDDPRGALRARAQEAKFPFLVSNILDAASHRRVDWQNMPASTIVDVAGIHIGIVGATTESVPYTTMPANFRGLAVVAPAAAIAAEAQALRSRGAQLVVAIVHVGSKCKDLEHPADLSTCDQSEELFKMIDGLPAGAVDVIVAGHTHAGVAHEIKGIAVIESFSAGRAFGRIDVQIAVGDGHVSSIRIFPPHAVCEIDGDGNPVPVADCKPGDYEGKPVIADPDVQAIADAAVARADERRKELLGVTLVKPITRAYGTESAEGNWFCDLMLAARPDAQVAVANGGGLRADVPAGDLTYGRLFEANPFDNRFAIVTITGKDLRTMVTSNLQRGAGILSWGGLVAKARCKAGKLDVKLSIGGKPIVESRTYKLVTSDFLASGGDGLFGRLKLPDGAIQMTDALVREAMADVLRKQKGKSIEPHSLFSPTTRRMDYEGERPIDCNPKAAPMEPSE